MRRSCSHSCRAVRARDKCVAAHGTGQQYQQWRIRQLSCINIILPSRIPVILFYFITNGRAAWLRETTRVCWWHRVAAIRPRGSAADATRQANWRRHHPWPVADSAGLGRHRRVAGVRQDRVSSARGLPAGLASNRYVPLAISHHHTSSSSKI